MYIPVGPPPVKDDLMKRLEKNFFTFVPNVSNMAPNVGPVTITPGFRVSCGWDEKCSSHDEVNLLEYH